MPCVRGEANPADRPCAPTAPVPHHSDVPRWVLKSASPDKSTTIRSRSCPLNLARSCSSLTLSA